LYTTGAVFWQYHFDGPVTPFDMSYGGDSEIVVSSSSPLTGDACIKLTTKSASLYDVATHVYLGGSPTGKIGVELWFKLPTVAFDYVMFGFLTYTGVYQKQATLKYVKATHKWQYLNSLGTYSDIPGGDTALIVVDENWHHLKWVFNLDTNKWIYTIINDIKLDMSTIALRTPANSNPLEYDISLRLNAPDATQLSLYVDSILITYED
jgi:hypothetical protein